jgi:hypothetical protein
MMPGTQQTPVHLETGIMTAMMLEIIGLLTVKSEEVRVQFTDIACEKTAHVFRASQMSTLLGEPGSQSRRVIERLVKRPAEAPYAKSCT